MQVAVPGKNPGEVFIPALGKSFQQIELREDDIFDTIETDSGAIAAGTQYKWFLNLTNKNEQHTSLPTPRRINAGDEAAIFRVGVHPREATGNLLPVFNDYRKVIGNGWVEVIFNRRLITQGPVVKYPSGYGVAGFSDESGATAVSVGVPSAAASPTLFVPQQLTDSDDLKCRLVFLDAAWTTSYTAPSLLNRVLVTLFMHGILKSPLGK